MKKNKGLDAYTPEEEIANAITHGLGILACSTGLIYTVLQADGIEFELKASTSIFFISGIVLYSASTLYHSVKSKQRKYLFKQLDHISIYLLIAGTFTPFAWGVLGETSFGKNMLLGVWLIALAGIIFKIFFTGKFEAISLLSYLGMGWLGFLMFGRISDEIGHGAVNFVIYGGAAYTLGVVFYLMRRIKYHHAIWHLFVLAGTSFHAYAVLRYVLV